MLNFRWLRRAAWPCVGQKHEPTMQHYFHPQGSLELMRAGYRSEAEVVEQTVDVAAADVAANAKVVDCGVGSYNAMAGTSGRATAMMS
eukprot:15438830-Alexandrium_andersonii.AAC.1